MTAMTLQNVASFEVQAEMSPNRAPQQADDEDGWTVHALSPVLTMHDSETFDMRVGSPGRTPKHPRANGGWVRRAPSPAVRILPLDIGAHNAGELPASVKGMPPPSALRVDAGPKSFGSFW